MTVIFYLSKNPGVGRYMVFTGTTLVYVRAERSTLTLEQALDAARPAADEIVMNTHDLADLP